MFSVEWLLFFLIGLSAVGGLVTLSALLVHTSRRKTSWVKWMKTHFLLIAGVGVGFVLASGFAATATMMLLGFAQTASPGVYY
tara:strand:- start:3 stop:251 length:249 start_codon:yes stop_codon:yes gene_type:complete